MDSQLPTRSALKSQAKRLRASLADQGNHITHAQSLEAIARHYGMRDWNTLHATATKSPRTPVLSWQIGQPVAGHYLGQPFDGHIKSVTKAGAGYWRLCVVFNQAVDVVASKQFSNMRRQVNCRVDANGRSPHKTSNGHPQIVFDT